MKTYPAFIRFKVESIRVKWTYILELADANYRLCGLIYYGKSHFTVRVVTERQEIWFNDSWVDGENYHYENKLENMQPGDLAIATDGRSLILAIYMLV